MARRLYVGNLSFNLTETALRTIFAPSGGVERAEIVTDRWTGRSRGFGFVEMMTQEDAETAIAELNGVEAMGRSSAQDLPTRAALVAGAESYLATGTEAGAGARRHCGRDARRQEAAITGYSERMVNRATRKLESLS